MSPASRRVSPNCQIRCRRGTPLCSCNSPCPRPLASVPFQPSALYTAARSVESALPLCFCLRPESHLPLSCSLRPAPQIPPELFREAPFLARSATLSPLRRSSSASPRLANREFHAPKWPSPCPLRRPSTRLLPSRRCSSRSHSSACPSPSLKP